MRTSTDRHELADLAIAGFVLAFPRLLGASSRFTRITTSLALCRIGYVVLNRLRADVRRQQPTSFDQVLHVAGGVALAGLPLVLKEKEKAAVVACVVAAGVADAAAAGLAVSADSTGLGAPTEKTLPKAGILDSLKIGLGVVGPTLAMGPIIRRKTIMPFAEALDFSTAAVKTLRALRDKYGSGPLMLKMSFRYQAVVLDAADLRRVLDESPEPFATASSEKRAALAHFEPKMALVSHGPEREVRRRLNEDVLIPSSAVHPLAPRLLGIVDDEAQALLRTADAAGGLRWGEFLDAWFCIVRRVIFGDAARNDRRITDLMAKLRADANWAFMKPVRTDLRDELHRRIHQYLERAESGSLAALMAARSPSALSAPENQIPQWLFAFEAAAMATFRALALLATHPEELRRARAECAGGRAAAKPQRPFLRATMMESLRLWPTTPLILRQTTRATKWENGIMPAHAGILIYAPYFHRDETRLPFANAFSPDVWLEDDPEVKGTPPRAWPLVPFSAGPAVCPGRNLVLLLTSGLLAALLGGRDFRLQNSQRLTSGMLPGMLNPFTLRFEVGSYISFDRKVEFSPFRA